MGWFPSVILAAVVATSGDGSADLARLMRSSSIATSGRSSPTAAISATGPTPPGARPTCGWIRRRRPRPIATAARAIVPGDCKRQRALSADHRREMLPSECRPRSPAKSLSPAEIEKLGRWIDQGAKWQPHWSFIPPARPPASRVGQTRERVAQPDRRVHSGPARARRARALSRGRARHLDPARHARPDRAAAHRGRNRRVRKRHKPGRLREGRRSPAGLAAAR